MEAWTKANQIVVKALIRNGVVILSGTDTGATSVVAGFSIHDELESLVNNGLSHSKALYSATVAPAKFANKITGMIKAGYKADLLLLSENPLDNISNTRSFEAVFFDKYHLTKDNKEALLTAILKANDKSRTIDISKWQ